MTWAAGPWLGIDTESTGVDPLSARIVTACVAYRSEADAGWTRDWLADAGHELIPEQATAIHGITSERAHAEGQPVVDVAEEVRELIVKAWANDVPVVAMNANYDLTLLNAELLRAGRPELAIDGPVLDPLVIDRAVDRYRRGSRKLPDLCAHYNVAHTAAAPGEDRDAAAGAHDCNRGRPRCAPGAVADRSEVSGARRAECTGGAREAGHRLPRVGGASAVLPARVGQGARCGHRPHLAAASHGGDGMTNPAASPASLTGSTPSEPARIVALTANRATPEG